MIIPKLLNLAANWPLDELCIRDKDAFVSYRVVWEGSKGFRDWASKMYRCLTTEMNFKM